MTDQDLGAPARYAYRPFHIMLAPFPVACFVGALITDLAYWRTAEMMWADASAWLLAVGLAVALFTLLTGALAFFCRRFSNVQGPILPYVIGSLVILTLSFVNNLVHSRDAWTSVVPLGVALSFATFLVILFTCWMGWTVVYFQRAGEKQ